MAAKTARFEKYTDASGRHRFRFKAKNGKTLFVSSESYAEKRCRDKALRVCQNCHRAPVVDLDGEG